MSKWSKGQAKWCLGRFLGCRSGEDPGLQDLMLHWEGFNLVFLNCHNHFCIHFLSFLNFFYNPTGARRRKCRARDLFYIFYEKCH